MASRPTADEGHHSGPLPDPPASSRHPLREQDLLWSRFIGLAASVVTALEKGVLAVAEDRFELVPEVEFEEEETDRLEVAIEQDCLRMLALYEPGSYQEVVLDNMRATIAARLVEAKQAIPHFYLTADVGTDALLRLREDANAAAPKEVVRKAARSRPDSATVKPPIRCSASLSGARRHRIARTSSTREIPTVYSEAVSSISRFLPSSLAAKASARSFWK